MKILISKDAYKPHLKEWAGQWLEVDTKHLFNNQYNTVNGLRVLDDDIEAVKDDTRHGRGSCNYCGAQFERGKECQCDKKYHKYFNSYFMQYPDGMKNKVSHVSDRCKVGTYFFSIASDEKTYYLHNMRQSIRFKYDGEKFAIRNGIGWDVKRRLSIPAPALKQLLKILA